MKKVDEFKDHVRNRAIAKRDVWSKDKRGPEDPNVKKALEHSQKILDNLDEATQVTITSLAYRFAKAARQKGLDAMFTKDGEPFSVPAIDLGVSRDDTVIVEMARCDSNWAIPDRFAKLVSDELGYNTPIPTELDVRRARSALDYETELLMKCQRGECMDGGLPRFLPSELVAKRLGKETMEQQQNTGNKDSAILTGAEREENQI